MKTTTFLADDPGLTGAWAKLTQALLFNPLQRSAGAQSEPPAKARSIGTSTRSRRERRYLLRESSSNLLISLLDGCLEALERLVPEAVEVGAQGAHPDVG